MRTFPAIAIGDRWQIAGGAPCLVVAEIGQNHNGQMRLARDLIAAAATAQVDAVKLCKRDIPSELTAEAAARPYLSDHSFGPTYGEHRQALELSAEDYAQLQRLARELGVLFFATACDIPSADVLGELDVPLFKVASRDLTNLPLLDYLARTGRPLVLSCGMDEDTGIAAALDTVRLHHNRVVLLQCTSAYPTRLEDVNLAAMASLSETYGVPVGLSDHSPGSLVPILAAAMGAVMVEKHVTLDRSFRGTDHACSLEPLELIEMVDLIRQAEKARGTGQKIVPAAVRPAREKLARVLVSRCEISQGTMLTEEMLCLKSGGPGLGWLERSEIVGRCACRDIPADVCLLSSDFAAHVSPDVATGLPTAAHPA